MHIEIHSTELRHVHGTSKRTGKPYSFTVQDAYVATGLTQYPERIELITPEEGQPFPRGKYLIDVRESLTVRNTKLHFAPVLKAAPAAAKGAA